MYKLEAIYRVVTPLFASGADQRKSAELRAPAFKGVLRFWYRAVALPFCNYELSEVRRREKELFGSTEGQASFMLQVKAVSPMGTLVPYGERWESPGSSYLGYGVIGWNRDNRQVETSRPYLSGDFRFTATLIMPIKKEKSADTEGLKRALQALGLCGGMGSRSRKGFGSLVLESLVENDNQIWTAPKNVEELRARIKEIFQNTSLKDEEPEYSAFSGKTRVAICPSNSDALALLDEVGKEMVRYRSYGQSQGNRRVVLGDETAEQNFRDDHDLIWNIVQGANTGTAHPRRVVFGLPHNYFFVSARQKVGVNARENQRRASPLFIHIHQLAEGCAAVFTLMPGRFLPPEDRVEIAVQRGNRVPVHPNVDYKVIHDFIDRFPNRLEVLP